MILACFGCKKGRIFGIGMIRKLGKLSDTKDENLDNGRAILADSKETGFKSSISCNQNTENLNDRMLAIEKQLSEIKEAGKVGMSSM